MSRHFFYCTVTQLSHGPRKEHCFPVSPLVLVRNLLPSNERCLRSHYLAKSLHATLCMYVCMYTLCIQVRKPERKRPLGRPRRRWVDNIKMDLREIGWDGKVWTGSVWLRTGTSGGFLWTRWWTFDFLKNAGNIPSGCTLGSFLEGLSSVSK
jgi:hypothetical protein